MGSRSVLRSLIVEPAPVLWISGTADCIDAFLLENHRDSTTAQREADDTEPSVELRLLERAEADGAPVRWVWAGPLSHLTHGQVAGVEHRAVQCGLTVVLVGSIAEAAGTSTQ